MPPQWSEWNGDYRDVVREAKRVMATFTDMEELIRLGAYRKGSSPEVDRAIALNGPFEAFLTQRTAHGQTVQSGQHDVEDEHVEVAATRRSKGGFAVRTQLHLMPEAREVVGHIGSKVRLIFN